MSTASPVPPPPRPRSAPTHASDDQRLPAEVRVLLTCLALVVAAALCRLPAMAEPRPLLLFVVLTAAGSCGLPLRAAALVAASAWAVHTGFVVDRLGVLDLSSARLSELLLLLGVATMSWLAGHELLRPRR